VSIALQHWNETYVALSKALGTADLAADVRAASTPICTYGIQGREEQDSKNSQPGWSQPNGWWTDTVTENCVLAKVVCGVEPRYFTKFMIGDKVLVNERSAGLHCACAMGLELHSVLFCEPELSEATMLEKVASWTKPLPEKSLVLLAWVGVRPSKAVLRIFMDAGLGVPEDTVLDCYEASCALGYKGEGRWYHTHAAKDIASACNAHKF